MGASEETTGAPGRQSDIPAQLERQADMLEVLDLRVISMEERLSPIMRMDNDAECGSDGTTEESICPIATVVRFHTNQITSVSSRLSALLDRIELP